jgi:choline dehydrogenase-like flavoprotein
MKITNLNDFKNNHQFKADVLIVGTGPAGITIARELYKSGLKIIIAESGNIEAEAASEELNNVESTGDPSTPAQVAKRKAFHGHGIKLWSHENQPYGVRCRLIGGASVAWGGKSAPFDALDFQVRPWVANSGWPIDRTDFQTYVDRAGKVLNLGPIIWDEKVWPALKLEPPKFMPKLSSLRSFFWQMARSRSNPVDIMRFGQDFVKENAANVQVLINATATEILTTPEGDEIDSVNFSTIDGRVRASVKAGCVIIATSAIENARLLLASKRYNPRGIGNEHDNVGRYLMDHPATRLGTFSDEVVALNRDFGFFALSHGGDTNMYWHGLSVDPKVQEREKMLNSAIYMIAERAEDDPWFAVKRLLMGKSKTFFADLGTVIKSSGLVAVGAGRVLLRHRMVPKFLKSLMVNVTILVNPNFAVNEFQTGGLPYKLEGMSFDGITEQAPDPESRITLSDTLDKLGVPKPSVHWKINDDVKITLIKLAHLVKDQFAEAGLPTPKLEDWVERRSIEDAVIIDMAHSSGTTRMSADPVNGVVDVNCQVHGVKGLYMMGASVFPTSGHANTTLMIVSLAIRLSEHLKATVKKAKR